MKTTIEIKNKYKMTFPEAFIVMTLNPGLEIEEDEKLIYRLNDTKLQYKNYNGEWGDSKNRMFEFKDIWYPVYPDGTAEWAVVQMYQGKIILVGKCYYRIENNELQVNENNQKNWHLSIFDCVDNFIEELSEHEFTVVDCVPEPEPEIGTLEWAEIQLEKPMPEGYGLTWGSRENYFRKNNFEYERCGLHTEYKWINFYNPFSLKPKPANGYVIEKLPVKKMIEEILIDMKSALRVLLKDIETLVDKTRYLSIRELHESAAYKKLWELSKEGE